MATKKINFPFLNTRECIREAREGEGVLGVEDINRGRFVVVWDKENPEEDCPLIYPLYSMTVKQRGEVNYTVLGENGYQMTFNHAAVIDECALPYVVCRNGKNSTPCVGRFIGCVKEDTDNWKCCVAPTGSAPVSFFKAEEVVYLDDVKFSIMEEDNG